MSLNIFIKVKTKFEESDYTRIKSRLMKKIFGSLTVFIFINFIKMHICVIYYIFKWIKKHLWTVSLFVTLIVSLLFYFASIFWCLIHFKNNQMHCEIIVCCFNIFFVEIQLKKIGKCFLGARIWASKPVYQSPKQPECIIRNCYPMQNLDTAIKIYILVIVIKYV